MFTTEKMNKNAHQLLEKVGKDAAFLVCRCLTKSFERHLFANVIFGWWRGGGGRYGYTYQMVPGLVRS